MKDASPSFDAVVIGAGFYGCAIALHLKATMGFQRIALVERGSAIMQRASLINQARIHQGHHYPRDYVTANRSRVSFPRFAARHRRAVFDSYEALYAISARNSQVSARQFQGMMRSVGAACEPASRRHTAMFDSARVEAVFRVEEFAFNAVILAEEMRDELEQAGVTLFLDTEVTRTSNTGDGWILDLAGIGRPADHLGASRVIECTYGRTGTIPGLPVTRQTIRFEICEVCLVTPPSALKGVGITVMDGPFFSCMPYPSTPFHTLTHVRWTPRRSWKSSDDGADPYRELVAEPSHSRFSEMRADAARLMPMMADVKHEQSLFEVKAVLQAQELNDGRPILVEGQLDKGGAVRVLGGKLDNVYDVLETLDRMLENCSKTGI